MAPGDPHDPRNMLYPETYFSDLSPPELRLALLSRGIHFEAARPLRYLELGFGTGFSLNVHAACNDGAFWGADFVRAHVEGAAALASISGADVHLLEDSFAQLLDRRDLPEFDIIAAHGIWTWIANEDRAAIVKLLERKLAPGGIFYVSYNNTAGWSSAVYLRQLMNLFCDETGQRDFAGITQSIAFARSLQSAGAPYFKENPIAAAELTAMAARNLTYLQQEYFVGDWKLMSLAEVEKALAPAGLRFGAQLPLLAHNDAFVLGAQGQNLLAALQSPILRETVRECFQGIGFRQDIFVKDLRAMGEDERRQNFRRQRFLLTTMPPNFSRQGKTPWGVLDLGARGCLPIIDALAAGEHAPQSIAELEAALPSIDVDDLIARVMLLAGVKLLRPTFGPEQQAPEQQAKVSSRCAALNRHILGLPGEKGAVLASPVLGAGVELSNLEKTFLAHYLAGERSPEAWADALARDCGGALGGSNAAELARMLANDHLPIFRVMGLTPD